MLYILVFLIAVAAMLAVKAVAIMGIFAIGMQAVAQGSITFMQAVILAVLLMLATLTPGSDK